MMHSLRIEQDLGFATLTAVGSYTEKKADLAFDNSIFNSNDPRTDTPELASSDGKSKTEYGELRLASPAGGRFRRSEAHTSELQSLMRTSSAVFCLTKKTKKHQRHIS